MSINENWCEWHIIVVEGHRDDPEVSVMHPGCGFTVTVGVPDGHSFEYACQIQWEIDNVGFDTLLGDNRDKATGMWALGWYRARMRHYTTRGFDWSEIDCDYETEALGVIAADQKSWLPAYATDAFS